MAKKMDRVEAFFALLALDRATADKQPKPRQWRSLLRAMDALDFSPAEQFRIARHLDIVRQDGRPFNPDISLKGIPWHVEEDSK